jgi:hypothetical protein
MTILLWVVMAILGVLTVLLLIAAFAEERAVRQGR